MKHLHRTCTSPAHITCTSPARITCTQHMHITCTHHLHTAHAHHLHASPAHSTCTSHAHMHITCTQHVHITCKHAHDITCKHAQHMHSTSHANIYTACTQHAHHMQTCTSHAHHMHVTCKHAHHVQTCTVHENKCRCLQWMMFMYIWMLTFIQHTPFITQFTHTHLTQATHQITHTNSRFNSLCFLPHAALAVISSSGIKGTETALQVLCKMQQTVFFISGISPPSVCLSRLQVLKN